MTTVKREMISVPRRTPSDTWQAICELVSKAGSPARAELERVADVAAQLIAQEATKGSPALFSGAGPQIRIYTLHDDASLEGVFDDELPLMNVLDDGDWSASLPADPSDLGWATTGLASRSTRVTAREAGT